MPVAQPVTTKQAQAGGIDLPLPSSPPATATAKPSTTPVTEADLKKATEKNNIEVAPKAKMGVASIEPGVVVMGSGVRVNVGDRFTSGERLLSVDKQNGKIVTDQRTVVITD